MHLHFLSYKIMLCTWVYSSQIWRTLSIAQGARASNTFAYCSTTWLRIFDVCFILLVVILHWQITMMIIPHCDSWVRGQSEQRRRIWISDVAWSQFNCYQGTMRTTKTIHGLLMEHFYFMCAMLEACLTNDQLSVCSTAGTGPGVSTRPPTTNVPRPLTTSSYGITSS